MGKGNDHFSTARRGEFCEFCLCFGFGFWDKGLTFCSELKETDKKKDRATGELRQWKGKVITGMRTRGSGLYS
jgi:hypothetical protein